MNLEEIWLTLNVKEKAKQLNSLLTELRVNLQLNKVSFAASYKKRISEIKQILKNLQKIEEEQII